VQPCPRRTWVREERCATDSEATARWKGAREPSPGLIPPPPLPVPWQIPPGFAAGAIVKNAPRTYGDRQPPLPRAHSIQSSLLQQPPMPPGRSRPRTRGPPLEPVPLRKAPQADSLVATPHQRVQSAWAICHHPFKTVVARKSVTE